MTAIAIESNGRVVSDFKIRTVGTVTCAVDHIHFRMVYFRTKCSCKARAVMVGNKGRIRYIYIVATISAVPLQCVLSIIFNGKIRLILQIQFVIGAKINSMHISSIRTIHRHGCIVQCQGRIFAGTNCHPTPFGIRRRTDACHYDIAVLKHQRLSPKGNALIVEHNLVLITAAIDCQVLTQIHSCGGTISLQENGITILCCSNCIIQRFI